MTADSTTKLREALAEALDEHAFAKYDAADAVLASLVEHRDDVLDVLGAEQVGWGCRIEGRIAASSTRAKRPSHAGGEFYEALYAFRPKEQPHG